MLGVSLHDSLTREEGELKSDKSVTAVLHTWGKETTLDADDVAILYFYEINTLRCRSPVDDDDDQ